MDIEQIKVRLKPCIMLLIIFMIAMTLRIVLNVARQEILYENHFLSSEGKYDERISSDALWYIYAAKGFLNGKGVLSMEKKIIPIERHAGKSFAGYVDRKEIDGEHYIHKTVPPLYPLFLALCYFLGGFNILAYFIPQLVLSSLTCLLIYFLAEVIFDKTVALFSSLAVAFYPDLIFWMSFARPETLFIFLLVLGFLLLLRGNAMKKPFFLYMSAGVFGLAALTRITVTPFLPFVIFWQARFFSKNRKESLKVALLMGLIISIVLLPWGIRNHIIFNKFTVLSDEAGTLIGSIETGEQYKGLEINQGYKTHESLVLKIFVFIQDNFKVYTASCWQRFIVFWSPFTYIMRPWAKIYKGLSWLIIFPAALWGIIISRKKWKNGAGLIILFIFYYSLLYSLSLMHLNLVYRYPIQPFLCIFASYIYCKIYKKIIG